MYMLRAQVISNIRLVYYLSLSLSQSLSLSLPPLFPSICFCSDVHIASSDGTGIARGSNHEFAPPRVADEEEAESMAFIFHASSLNMMGLAFFGALQRRVYNKDMLQPYVRRPLASPTRPCVAVTEVHCWFRVGCVRWWYNRCLPWFVVEHDGLAFFGALRNRMC